ncbi:adenylate/guanylate cyclase domain-containing protein [Flavobacteriaceae bacterium R38]|nr:adenylate/guanylate cyclase domain-containing protein [Flavobacteriaceae bacterium R38]
MLSPKYKRNINRIIPIAIIWLFFGIIYSLLEKGILADLDAFPATNTPYNFKNSLLVTSLSSFITGILIGTLEVLYLNRFFNKQNFLIKIFIKTFTYLVLICLFLFAVSAISNSFLQDLPVYDPLVLKSVEYFLIDFAFWSVVLYIGAIVIISLFVLEVSDSLGSGVLTNFISGKYHRPIQEERIFMFLDMKSSTTIAENLGHVEYFKLLKRYYASMSDAIISYSGEVYQYVGDEIVISWTLKKGIKNNNCVACFYAIKEQFRKKAKKFERDFGLIPGFKAAIHYGNVTTGEIGDVKKEILFTGDVLNTTARIQSLCNDYNADLLLSEKLLSKLKLSDDYNITPIGETELKGKDTKVSLYSIDENLV